MKMKIIGFVFVLCFGLCLSDGFNFNIFRWPSFNRQKSFPGSLQGFSKMKSQPFTGFRGIKGPIVRGIRNFYNFKKNLFNHVASKVTGGKGDSGDGSSYFRQAPSHYGETDGVEDDNNNGFFQVSYQGNGNSGFGNQNTPSSSYGAPTGGGFSPSAPINNNGLPMAGYGGNTGGNAGRPFKNTLQPQPLQNTFGQNDEAYNEISAPLQAVMQIGNILGAETPAQANTGQWRPVLGNQISGVGAGNNGQYSNNNGGLNPIGVGSTGLGGIGSNGAGGIGATGPNNFGATGNGIQPQPILNQDTLLIGDEKAHFNAAGQALSHVADPTIQGVATPVPQTQLNQDSIFIGPESNVQYNQQQNGRLQPSNLIRGNSFSLNNQNNLNNNNGNIQNFNNPTGLNLNNNFNNNRPQQQVAVDPLFIDNNQLPYNNNNNNINNQGGLPPVRNIQENLNTPVTSDTRVVRQDNVPTRPPTRNGNIMFAGLMEELQLNAWITLIRRANLEAMLTTEGGFTIFAPTDAAFSILPRFVIEDLKNNTEKLRELVLYHVVPGVLSTGDLRHEDVLDTATPKGSKLRVNVYQYGDNEDQIFTVNGARIKRGDQTATNGVIHIIDRVLYPMTTLSVLDQLTECDSFTGANVAVTGAGLTSVLDQEGPYTFFIPTTEAFAAIDNATVSSFIQNITMLQNVLMYHVVPGSHYSEGLRDSMWLPTLVQDKELQVRITTDGYTRRLDRVGRSAKVIQADIPASNGVIHVIDTVLRPELEGPICGYF